MATVAPIPTAAVIAVRRDTKGFDGLPEMLKEFILQTGRSSRTDLPRVRGERLPGFIQVHGQAGRPLSESARFNPDQPTPQ